MRCRLLRLAAPLLLLAGCGDDAYYVTRSMPTSSADTWGTTARLFRGETAEVYELPAQPPAVDGPPARGPARAPGQRFPAFPLVAQGDPPARYDARQPAQPVGALDDAIVLAPVRPLARTPIAAWHPAAEAGVREPIGVRPVGAGEDGPRSQPGSGLDRIPAQPAGGWVEADVWSGSAVPPTAPLR